MAKKSKSSYEAAYAELQGILAKIQNEEVGVDELGGQIKRAVTLIKSCKEKLRATETEIRALFKEE